MKTKGFTLIELLVVITIIGILATGAVAVFTGAQQKARDAIRQADIRALQTAVEQFYTDYSIYPEANTELFTGTTSDVKNGQLVDRALISKQLKDPSSSPSLYYGYASAHDDGTKSGTEQPLQFYQILVNMEAKANQERTDNDGADDTLGSADDPRNPLDPGGNEAGYEVGNAVTLITSGGTSGKTDANATLAEGDAITATSPASTDNTLFAAGELAKSVYWK